jgi:hypothetical protein
MVHGLTDVMILVAIACICVGVIVGIWFAIRAACRKVGLRRGYQVDLPKMLPRATGPLSTICIDNCSLSY